MTSADANRVLRFATTTTVAAGFAFAVDYSLAVITPLLTAVFLLAPVPRPTLRQMAGILVAAAAGMGLGAIASLLLSPRPILLMLGVGWILFRAFLAAARGASSFVALMILIGALLVPVLGTMSMEIAIDFAQDFLIALALALAFVQLGFEVLPDPASEPRQPPAPQILPASAQLAFAIQRTAIVLPLFALLVFLQSTDQLSALMYVAILSLGADPAAGWRATLPMLGGALIGGGAALVIYLTTSMLHALPILLLLVALALLWMGRNCFRESPSAVFFASAPTAMLLLISSSSELFGDETGARFLARVSAILLAAAVLSVGLPLAARWLPAGTQRMG